MISQVVLGLQNPLTAEKGDRLVGMITLKPDFSLHRYVYLIANILPLDFSDIFLKSFSIPVFLLNRSSLRIHLTTSFSGPKSEESEEREYLLWKYSNMFEIDTQIMYPLLKRHHQFAMRPLWSTWMMIDNGQSVLNLFRFRIIFMYLEFRGKEMFLSRILGSYYKLPKSDLYAVY